MNILCVEDEPDIADILRQVLTEAGHSVTLVANATPVLGMVARQRPDVVLLDANLPDMDGFDLCAVLRHELHVPVIMVTARASDDQIISGFEHGADDYITKPFDLQVLLHRVEAVTRYNHSRPSDDTAS